MPSAADSAATTAQRLDIRTRVAAWLGVPLSTLSATPSPSPSAAPARENSSSNGGRHLSPHAADALMGVGLLLAVTGLGLGALAAWVALRPPPTEYSSLLSDTAAAAAAAAAKPTGKGPKGPAERLAAWQWAALGAGALVPGIVCIAVGATV